ncbi:hypothetical protein IWZ01DRAFT_480486 [Phyllosticta capitalensis]
MASPSSRLKDSTAFCSSTNSTSRLAEADQPLTPSTPLKIRKTQVSTESEKDTRLNFLLTCSEDWSTPPDDGQTTLISAAIELASQRNTTQHRSPLPEPMEVLIQGKDGEERCMYGFLPRTGNAPEIEEAGEVLVLNFHCILRT